MGFREKIIIFGVLPWLIVILSVMWALMPVIGQLQGKLEELKSKEDELVEISQSIQSTKNTGDIEKKINDLKSKLKGFNKQFPPTKSLEDFYVNFQKASNETHTRLKILSVDSKKELKLPPELFEKVAPPPVPGKVEPPKEDSKRGKPAELPVDVKQDIITIDAEGTFQGIVDLLYYLSNYSRFFGMQGIMIGKDELTNKTASSDTLIVQIIMAAYTYKEVEIVPETEKQPSLSPEKP